MSSTSIKCLEEVNIELDDQVNLELSCKKLAAKIRDDWNGTDLDRLDCRLFKDGITNVLVGVFKTTDPNDIVLIRLYGHKTEEIIDRQAEVENMKAFQKNGCGPILYGTFKNGLAYSFIHGQITSQEMIVDKEVNQAVIEMMAKMHKMKLGGEPCMWKRLRKFLKAVPDDFSHDPVKHEKFMNYGILPKAALSQEIDELESKLKDSPSPVVFCHNDLLLGNIVFDPNREENKAIFIDYEYGDQNYQALDIANHFCEFVGVVDVMDYAKWYPDKAFQMDWIRRYLTTFNDGVEPTPEELEETYKEVNKFALCSHLMWSIWSLVQANNSTIDFDFLDYSRQRLHEYKLRKIEFLSL